MGAAAAAAAVDYVISASPHIWLLLTAGRNLSTSYPTVPFSHNTKHYGQMASGTIRCTLRPLSPNSIMPTLRQNRDGLKARNLKLSPVVCRD